MIHPIKTVLFSLSLILTSTAFSQDHVPTFAEVVQKNSRGSITKDYFPGLEAQIQESLKGLSIKTGNPNPQLYTLSKNNIEGTLKGIYLEKSVIFEQDLSDDNWDDLGIKASGRKKTKTDTMYSIRVMIRSLALDIGDSVGDVPSEDQRYIKGSVGTEIFYDIGSEEKPEEVMYFSRLKDGDYYYHGHRVHLKLGGSRICSVLIDTAENNPYRKIFCRDLKIGLEKENLYIL